MVRDSGASVGVPLWGLLLAIAGVLSFFITWFGLAQGRRIQGRAQRSKSVEASKP